MTARWVIVASGVLLLMGVALASRLAASSLFAETPTPTPSEQTEPAVSTTPSPDAAAVKAASISSENPNSKSSEQTAGTSANKSDGKAGDKTAPRKPEVLIKDRKFRREAPEGALRVSFDDLDLLKVLNMEPVTVDCVDMMPKWLKDLNGKKVRIRGYMHPAVSDPDANTEFALARDTQICCFGRSPKIYDIIQVTLKVGVTTRYIELRPFDVIGTLRIEIDPEDFKARKPGEEVDEYDLLNLGGLYYLDEAAIVVR